MGRDVGSMERSRRGRPEDKATGATGEAERGEKQDESQSEPDE